MSSCTGCDPTGCAGIPNSVMLLKKLDYMISDNYTLLFIFIIIMAILTMCFLYFFKSLKTNLSTYFKDKAKVKEPSGDNPRIGTDDSYTYYEIAKDDPEPVEPKDMMPVGKKEFIKNVDDVYKQYNDLKSEYIKKTYTSGKTNDDVIDIKTLYKEYDDYKYTPDDD